MYRTGTLIEHYIMRNLPYLLLSKYYSGDDRRRRVWRDDIKMDLPRSGITGHGLDVLWPRIETGGGLF
jgi:hypothetical protein